jgi:hypothetical protein
MLGLLITMGQATSAMLLLYGAYLVTMPKAPLMPMRSEKLLLLRRHA